MKSTVLVVLTALMVCQLVPKASAEEVIFEDHFDRSESDETQEQVGGGWGTNSRTWAAGNKQVDLADGALLIFRHKVADHGVSVVQNLAFKDTTIPMRFKISQGDELGINIADMKEKSVHAGHLCVAKIRPNKITLIDLKTGRTKLEMRETSKAKTLSAADKKLIRSKKRSFPIELDTDQWHQPKVNIADETMTVSIDGKQIGSFPSPGIDHPTKLCLRLAVAKQAWVDDVIVVRQ